MPWLRGGTVAVVNGSTTVTGTGADFAANSRVGDAFIGPDGFSYEIGNVASATVISIIPAYKGATASGVAYAIMPVQGYPKALADAFNTLKNQYGTQLAALGTTGNYETLPVTKGGTGGTTQVAAQSGLGLPKTTTRLSVTAGEVVKVADYGRNGGANIVQVSTVDANTLTVPASYVFNGGGVNVPEAAYLDHVAHAAAGYSKQMASALLNDNAYVRTQNNGTFGAWKQFVTKAIGSAIAIADGGTGNTTGTAAKLAASAMVGTVSQTSGVPTGAIVERGANAQGSYTKFADGTLICKFKYRIIRTLNSPTGSLFCATASEPAQNFPAVFAVEAPVISILGGIETGEAWFLPSSTLIDSLTQWPAGWVMSQISRPAKYITIDYVAIGRWF